jgi:hypothetical protein
MAHTELETRQRIYESLRSGLTGRIAKLTNFTDRSFNYVWTQAFSEEIRELQELAFVSELTGFIDYTGGPITEDDLEDIGVAGRISPEIVNELMEDEYLDEYVKIVGVTRNQGSPATGTVTFSTQSSQTTIPEGTTVTTAPEADGSTTDFVTTEEATTADGVSSVSDVSIESVDVGEEYNVPAGKITRISNPPVGVTGVNNVESTTGGEDVETNDELRSRAKQALAGASEGGTVEGIKAFIRGNVDGVQQGDIIIDEFVEEQPPFVDVIVDGGLEDAVIAAIETSRPAGIEHNLVRPQVIQIGADLDLLGVDINNADVAESVENFLLELGLGEEFYQDQFIREIMLSDDDIVNIDFLDTTIERVTNEEFNYSTDIQAAVASDGGTLTEETESANDGNPDDITLLPASPSVGDAYYFGQETIFAEMEIDISTAGAGTWDTVWEYYDGSNWVQLPNISDGTSDFQNGGIGLVEWDIPSDWASTDVSDSPLYWVRARLDTFSSISTQPLGQEVDITGPGFRLDYTVEEENGSITVQDERDVSYDLNTDFVLIDNTGDTWSETLVWKGGLTPDERTDFSVDYDVTVPGKTKDNDSHSARLVRDEPFTFNLSDTDTRTYNNTSQVYELDNIPFEDSVSIVDQNSTSFTEDTDFQLTPTQDYATTDTFTYQTGTSDYTLSSDVEIDFAAVFDADQNIYVRGTDYTLVDTDSDGFADTIRFDSNNSVPADGTEFTVVFDAYPDGIRWDPNNSTPPQDNDFTVTYDQAYYETKYEIVETRGGVIRDASGDTYQEDTEYTLVDETRDGEDDGVFWQQQPSSLGNGEEFFITYLTEGDVRFGEREKADPGTINVEARDV